MAYDEGVAKRVREALAGQLLLVEKKMFGGIAFMLRGNMCCGVMDDQLIVRVGPDNYSGALAKPHTREFDFTGRPMKGFVVVSPEGFSTGQALAEWVRQGASYALSLPEK
jgi:TfoX/Sxy family transcriptional regulator of competence genes